MSKKTKILAVVALLLILVIAAVCFVGPAKGVYLSLRYSPQVTRNFKDDFNPVNSRLSNDYAIAFKQHNNSKKDCGPGSGYYSSDTFIFGCRVSLRADPVVADEAFVTKWREASPKLEAYLLADGWEKQWNQNQPIHEILDKPQNDTSIGVNYAKKHGEITCTLTFMWIMPETPNHLTVDEVCEMYQST